ncbi:MAG: hypothetical protein Q9157_002784 [Trypethelium eluteriae]
MTSNSRQGPVLEFCESVRNLSTSLSPYFEAISSFVQSDPHIAGLIWGSILMVFKLCQNYSTFVEKLKTVLQRMAQELAAIEFRTVNVQTTLNRRGNGPTTHRLQDALSHLYSDIVGLCHRLYRMFSSKGKGWQRAKLLMNLAWKPFDIQFAECLDRFQYHKRLLILEIDAAATQILLDEYDKIEREIATANHQSDGLGKDVIRMVLQKGCPTTADG